jgi:hypothetical protein
MLQINEFVFVPSYLLFPIVPEICFFAQHARVASHQRLCCSLLHSFCKHNGNKLIWFIVMQGKTVEMSMWETNANRPLYQPWDRLCFSKIGHGLVRSQD